MMRPWTWLDRLLCSLSGHRGSMLAFDQPGRVYLRCPDCGHGSPGWQVGKEQSTRVIPFLNLRHVREEKRRVA